VRRILAPGVKLLQELRYHISRSLLRRYVRFGPEDSLVSAEYRLPAARPHGNHDHARPGERRVS